MPETRQAVFEVAGLRLMREVVIDESGDSFADFILPLDLKVEEEVLVFTKAMKPEEVKVLTRSQARAEAELERSDTREVSRGYELSVGESYVDGEECEQCGMWWKRCQRTRVMSWMLRQLLVLWVRN